MKSLNELAQWLDRLIDRALLGLVRNVSGRTVAFLAILAYLGLGLVVPLSFGWSATYLVGANLTGVSLAAALTLGWLGLQIQAQSRRHLVEWTSDLRRLDAQEFEWLVGELYRREGWSVTETGRQDSGDGNVDLVLTDRLERRIVQCKRWTANWVGVDEIRSFAGTLMRENLPGSAGIFVTLSTFTQQARDEASTIGMTLVDNRDLYAHLEKVRRPEPCPVCAAPMVLGRSDRGWWFRCLAKGCAGKRDLGADPGLAISLLVLPPN
jgi:hypothetical protein